jgi:hypothetical protein
MSTETNLEVKQASDIYLVINCQVNGLSLPILSAAKYIVFNRASERLITKTLGNGITYNSGIVTVHLTDTDSDLQGNYNHECVVKDMDDNDIFILTGKIRFIKTTARIV